MKEILLATFDQITANAKEAKIGRLLNLTFCALFNEYSVGSAECKEIEFETETNSNAQYVAYGIFEIVADEKINFFELFVVDTFSSFLFKSVFAQNMNAKLKSLQFEPYFKAIAIEAESINFEEPRSQSLGNGNEMKSWSNLDIFLVILLAFLVCATCLASVYILRYCHRRNIIKEGQPQSNNCVDDQMIEEEHILSALPQPMRKRSHHWGFTEDAFGETIVSNTFNSDAHSLQCLSSLHRQHSNITLQFSNSFNSFRSNNVLEEGDDDNSVKSVEEMYSLSKAIDGARQWTALQVENENECKVKSYSDHSNTLEIEEQKGIGNISNIFA